MTATSHALIGASIASLIPNPILAIPLAITSHFAADLVPHWDAGTNRRKKSIMQLRFEAALDVILGFILVYLIFGSIVSSVYLFIMIIAAQLPDWLETPSSKFGLKIPPFSWVEWLGHKLQNRMQLPWGLVSQVVIVGFIVVFAISRSEISNQLTGFF